MKVPQLLNVDQDAMGLPSDFRTHTVPGETPWEAPW